ncbi:hypothetical protein TNCV_2727011 [Trichonephila clavipes]|nr:hypothetical protein TNCV_2727011 [Trichonephila clavipes]
MWGYVKSLVYADKPQTLDHLEDNIRRVIADIRPQMLEKVIENWTSRLDYIRASRGKGELEAGIYQRMRAAYGEHSLFQTIDADVLIKGDKRYQISMTMSAQSSPMKPRQPKKSPLKMLEHPPYSSDLFP